MDVLGDVEVDLLQVSPLQQCYSTRSCNATVSGASIMHVQTEVVVDPRLENVWQPIIQVNVYY